MAQGEDRRPQVIFDEARGFRRLDPVPRSAEIEAFYESHYRDLLDDHGRAPDLARLLEDSDEAERERAWLGATLHADVVDALERLAPTGHGRRVIDIGAGTGDLVHSLVVAGWDAVGTEPSAGLAAAGRARGLRIAEATAGRFLAAAAIDGSAAPVAMTIMNVLEHLPDPEALLEAARPALAPGGLLIARVPNDFNPLQAAASAVRGGDRWWISVPDHINYFDHASLAAFLGRHGFEILEQSTDFPMELFILEGDDYVANPAVGRTSHERRRRLELALPPELRRSIGRALVGAGVGRNAFVVARVAG